MSLVDFQNSQTIPVNGQSEYTSSNGNFNLAFQLSGSANMALDLNSIRLVCEVDYLTGSGQHLNNNDVYGLGVRVLNAAANAAPPAASILPNFDIPNQSFVDVDARTGVNMCINSILFEDSENNVLENVVSFPHLINKVVSMTMSQDDQLTWGGSTYGISGGGKSLVNQHSLNSTKDVAIKLYTGLSQSAPLPYSAVRSRLNISIQLNSSSAVFNGGSNHGADFGVGTSHASLNNGCFYRLKNVKMVFRNLIFDDPEAPILKSGYSYRHFSSLQSTINSSNNTNIYQPNATNAISIMSSFIPSTNLNNYSKNSVQSGKLKNQIPAGTIYPATVPESVKIHTVDLLKNNVSFPLTYPIDESVYTQNNSGLNNYETQRSYYYLSTIKPFNMINSCLISPSTENYGGFYEATSADYNVPVSAGVGIRYANVSSTDGTNYRGASFQQRINSGLNSSLNNELFTNILSTRRIIIGANGPVVLP